MYKNYFKCSPLVLTEEQQLRILVKTETYKKNPLIVWKVEVWNLTPFHIEELSIECDAGISGNCVRFIESKDKHRHPNYTDYTTYSSCFVGESCITLTKEKAEEVLEYLNKKFDEDRDWQQQYQKENEDFQALCVLSREIASDWYED